MYVGEWVKSVLEDECPLGEEKRCSDFVCLVLLFFFVVFFLFFFFVKFRAKTKSNTHVADRDLEITCKHVQHTQKPQTSTKKAGQTRTDTQAGSEV